MTTTIGSESGGVKSTRAGELVLTNYFSVRDGRVVSLVVVFDQPAY